MFGYIIADRGSLKEAEVCRYGGCYCGLCKTLGKRHGLMGRMTLNYDMTFLVLVLNALYEPGENAGEARCPIHPLKKRPYWNSRFTDYAADLNLILAWWNCMDDWQDERKLSRLLLAKCLRPKVKRLEGKYPRQWKAIEDNLALIHKYESGPEQSADRAADAFGDLMGELFVPKPEDYWAKDLRTLGQSLGRFIYMMDACVDLEEDRKKGRPNPLLSLTEGQRTRQDDIELLTMLLGDASSAFEHMPIVEDAPILRNILYSGLWQKYDQAFYKRDNKKE